MNRHDRAELLARLAGRPLVVSLSGGKDSVATCLYLQELDLPHERVFQNTVWDAEEHLDYLRTYLPAHLGPVTEIRASKYPGGFRQLVLERGAFPSRTMRFCTDELKTTAMSEYLATRADDPVNVVGIRWAESEKRRATWVEWSYSKALDCDVWAPILPWEFADVAAAMRRHDVRPSPLYLRGCERVGCWPCVQAGRDELRIVGRDAARVAEIRELERQVAEVAARRPPSSPENGPPTMFQRHTRDQNGKRHCVPFDDVIRWARTTRGGRQYDLLVDVGTGEDIGCARWGFCDAGPGDDSCT